MVELHSRDEATGSVTRAIYETLAEAEAQASGDVAQGLTRVPFLVVAHDPAAAFDPEVQGYNPLALDQLDVLDADTLSQAAS